jgi:hypothetical protein
MQPERIPWRVLSWTGFLLFVLCCVGNALRMVHFPQSVLMGTVWPLALYLMLTCIFRDVDILRVLAIASVVTISATLLLPEVVALRGRQDVFRLIAPLALGVLFLVVDGLFSRLGWPSCPKPPLPDEKLPRSDGA